MKILKYKKYLESISILDIEDLRSIGSYDVMESMNIWHDVLLTSIGAEEVDVFDTLKLSKDKFEKSIDLIKLSDSVEFINSLSSLGLKKSAPQNSEDFETFLNKPCKFMMIYDHNSNELENPEYILFQSWNSSLNKWEESRLFKVKDDIKLFFDKLSSKTIEIVEDKNNFIYSTSNGNDWELQNLESETDDYQRFLSKEDLQSLVDSRHVKIKII